MSRSFRFCVSSSFLSIDRSFPEFSALCALCVSLRCHPVNPNAIPDSSSSCVLEASNLPARARWKFHVQLVGPRTNTRSLNALSRIVYARRFPAIRFLLWRLPARFASRDFSTSMPHALAFEKRTRARARRGRGGKHAYIYLCKRNTRARSRLIVRPHTRRVTHVRRVPGHRPSTPPRSLLLPFLLLLLLLTLRVNSRDKGSRGTPHPVHPRNFRFGAPARADSALVLACIAALSRN